MLPDRRSDRTLALLFLYNSYIQYCRNFNPIASYCRFIGRSCGSQILIFDAVEFFAALNNTCRSDKTLVLLFLYNSYIQCNRTTDRILITDLL